MKTIDNDIKRQEFKKVYLLYGEERYLIRQYRDKLKKALASSDDTMNFSSFEGDDINVKEIIDLAETLPFFADRRVILIEDSKLFKKGGDELGEYLAILPDTTYFVFVEEEVDKRSKLFKAVGKCGNAIEFGKQTDETLMKWVGARIGKEGKNITQAAYQSFISKTGTDMQNIEKELEKLICYCMEKDVIEAVDVEAITTEQISNKVFEMVDAIASHKQKHAMDLYYDLLALKEAPMRILFLITRQFQILLTIKVMSHQGFGNKDIAAKAGCPEWAVRKYQGQAKSFSLDQIKQAITDGVSYEEAVKTGKMNDQMAVELFIVQYSKVSN
jgi:DNA polymerase-3 subunit delta